MASKVAIGKMRYEAMVRVQDAMPRVAGKLGIPVVEIPTQGRDLDLLHVRQLEAHAEFYEQIQGALDEVHERLEQFTSEANVLLDNFIGVLEHLTVKQLEALVKASDVEPSGTKKDDLIHALVTLPELSDDAPEEVENVSTEDEVIEEAESNDGAPEEVEPIED